MFPAFAHFRRTATVDTGFDQKDADRRGRALTRHAAEPGQLTGEPPAEADGIRRLASLYPASLNFQVVPGYDYALRMTPDKSGDFRIVCNEFCGIGHHTMVGRIIVVDDSAGAHPAPGGGQ